MRKSVLFLYITLNLYTLIHLVFFFSNQGALESLIKIRRRSVIIDLIQSPRYLSVGIHDFLNQVYGHD